VMLLLGMPHYSNADKLLLKIIFRLQIICNLKFNKKALPFNYTLGQLIWVDIQNYLGRNKKLSPNWGGPFTIC
jgi:hypothetical protein